MPIVRKNEKPAGLPSKFVKLAERAATFAAASEFFDTQKKDHKKLIEDYLEEANCPITVTVGKDGGVKVPGVAGFSFSQPSRLDNDATKAAIIEGVKAGRITVDALAELISTCNAEACEKVFDAETFATLKPASDKVIVTMRVAGEYKADVFAQMLGVVAEVYPSEEETVTAPVAQPLDATPAAPAAPASDRLTAAEWEQIKREGEQKDRAKKSRAGKPAVAR